MTQAQWYRILALKLRNHHLRHCEGVECNISLSSIREMAEAAGAEFSETERAKFSTTEILPTEVA